MSQLLVGAIVSTEIERQLTDRLKYFNFTDTYQLRNKINKINLK
jgi:hypothetical protein